MSPKQRNARRRYRAGVAEKLGIGVLALGVLQPVFGPSAITPTLVAIAFPSSVALLVLGDYIMGKMEDEE